MKYELAKKLKDAGFPQKDDRSLFEEDFVSYPTLEELIKACGGRINQMTFIPSEDRTEGIWIVRSFQSEDDLVFKSEHLEEAVANLWLMLNEKNDL